MEKFPEGKYLSTVKIGPKGQVVIPKEVRDMFSIESGDTLILMADKSSGIAIQPYSYMEKLWSTINQVNNAGDDNK